MDEHTGFGTHGPETAADEERLIREADLVLVTSRKLEERMARLRSDLLRLPNAGDERHFGRLPSREGSPIGRLPRPVIGYYGAISAWFDADALRQAATRHPDWSFALVGDTRGAELGGLAELPNVHLPGEVPYAELPAWLAAFDVCTIPFRRTPLTEATNPVKIFEYFATGKPVVARRLPELEPFEDAEAIALYETPEDFVRALERAVKESVAPGPAAGRRRAIARENTWQARYETLRGKLGAIPARERRAASATLAASGTGEAAVARRAKEIRRLAVVIRERDEGITFLREEVAGRERVIQDREAQVRDREEQVRDRERQMAELEREKNKRIRNLEEALSESQTLAEARGVHLRTALEELERWEHSRLGQIRKVLSALRGGPGSARRALGRATAPGTPIFELGRKTIPRPLARVLRRTLAPVEQPEKMVTLAPEVASRAQDAVAKEPSGRADAVVFSIIDWDFRFQRPQQLATQFGRHGHRVFYLSTTAVPRPRRPGLGPVAEGARTSWSSGSARAGRSTSTADAWTPRTSRRSRRPSQRAAPRPRHGRRRVARPDSVLGAARRAAARAAAAGRSSTTAWTSGPTSPASASDVLALEEELVRGADVTVVSADRLLEKWQDDRAAADARARTASTPSTTARFYAPNDLLGDARHPVIGYYGALASWVDVAAAREDRRRASRSARSSSPAGVFDVDLSPHREAARTCASWASGRTRRCRSCSGTSTSA